MDPLNPDEVEIGLIFAPREALSEIQTDFQKCHTLHFGMKPGIEKSATNCICGPSFYPRGSNLNLFSLCRQQFARYGLIFKTAIFGHETWKLKKSARSLTFVDPLSTPGVEIELIFALRAEVSDVRAGF